MQGGQFRAENTQSSRRDAIRLAAILGCEWLNQALLLQASNCPVQCSGAQAGSAHARNVFDHGMSMPRSICEAGKHKQGRVGIVSSSRVRFAFCYVMRTSHNVVTAQIAQFCNEEPEGRRHQEVTARTAFGNVSLESPWLEHFRCRPHAAKAFSPPGTLRLQDNSPEPPHRKGGGIPA